MEVLFIWIAAFNKLKDCYINFGGEYRFYYDSNDNKLMIEKDNQYIPNFFDSNISNLSVLIGKNGVGKSTFLEFIISHFPEGQYDHEPDAIVIYKMHDSLYIYCRKERFDKLKPIDKRIKYIPSLTNNFSDIKIIYYTNSFYDRINDQNTAGLTNISLKNLLLFQDQLFSYSKENPRPQDLFVNHYNIEYLRLIKFIKAKETFDFRLSLPDYLIIGIVDLYEVLKQKFFSSAYPEATDLFSKINEKFKEFINAEKSRLEKFKINLYRAILYNRIRNNPSSIDFENIRNILSGDFRTRDLFDALEKYFRTNNMINEISFISEISKNIKDKNISFLSNKVWLEISEVSEENFRNLLNNYFNTITLDYNYIEFGFSHSLGKIDDFSSGQRAYLSMFSRFFSLKDEEQPFDNLKLPPNVMVLIDEGELYLHPEWQREFIYKLVTFLPSIYRNSKIQIILTSHSPFIISDIPKSKVVFLKEINGKVCVVDGLKEHSQTFASNIHTLLSESFFLEDGLLGEFATKKINEVIKILLEDSISDITERRQYIENIINIIGEPVIKNKLLKILHERLSANLISLKSDIDLMKERLKKLEEGK